MKLDNDTLGGDPDLLDGDDLGDLDEPSPEELAGLFDDGVEGDDADLLRYVGIELEQEAAGALDADLLVAARQACGNLGLLDDAGVIGIAVKCQEIAARAQGRMFRALQELQRRRPPSRRYRQGEDVRGRRGAAEGITENVTVQRMPVMASAEAASEIALAFTSTEYAAQKLGEISADLWARMPRLHLELEAGRTTDDRLKIIWEGTRDLSNEDAGKVDELLSAGSGAMTTGELRDAVRRAVIRIDPDAADKRRQRAEKKARTSLYANANGTATYALEDIPPALGAAAKARVNAIARAAKSAGAKEELPMLEAKSALGLILGTLPLIPPQVPPGDAPEDPGGPGGPGGLGGSGGPPGPGLGAGPGDWDAVPGPDPAPGYRPASEEFGTDPEPVPDSMPWPAVPATSSASAPGCVPIPAGLLRQGRIKLLMPWRSLAGMTAGIGELSWFGPVTPAQARDLATAATSDPGTRWSLIVTDDDGRALAFGVLRHPRETSAPGLVGEVTLTITASLAAGLNHDEEMRARARQMLTGLDPATAGLLQEAIAIADKAAVEAELQAILDEAAGGCAHATEVKAYKVPETMRRWLTARDFTCANPICRQRARQCDWDHTIPYGQGGRTCPCGLGPLCRHHHQLKQAEGWQLSQNRQGHFTWTTPAGLSYRAEPHKYLV